MSTGQGVWVAFLGLFYEIVLDTGFLVHQWDLSLTMLTHYLYASNPTSAVDIVNGINPRCKLTTTCRNHPQLIFVLVMLFLTLMGLIKTAILLEWLHIFVPLGIHNSLYWIIVVCMWTNLILYGSLIIVSNISCTPHEYYWNRLIPGGSCHRADTTAADAASAGITLVIDICILAIPQRAIWTLKNMPWRRRLGIAVLFAIGFLGIAAACVRLYMTLVLFRKPDYTYDLAWELIPGTIEPLCGLLVICGPTIPRAVGDIYKLLQPAWTSWSLTGGPKSTSIGGDFDDKRIQKPPKTRDTLAFLDGDDDSGGCWDVENVKPARSDVEMDSLPKALVMSRPVDSSNSHRDIRRHTEVEVSENVNSHRSFYQPHRLDERQHPWIGREPRQG